MGRYRAKGVITVFFSLTSVLVLSLICTALESARIQGARAQTANITDMGNYSVFGEYEKKLLEKYEIFSVDGSYGTGDFSIERVNGRLKDFMSLNASPKKELLAELCFDPWNLQLNGSEIQEYALLTDQGGEAFYQQAVAYMKKTIVSSSVGKLFEYHHDAITAQSKEEEYKRKKNSSDREMEELEKQEKEKEKELEESQKTNLAGGDVPAETEENSEPVEKKDNPLKMLKKLARKSILELVCGQTAISDKKVSGRDLSSKRSNKKGKMKIEKENGGLISDLLFREYLLDRFPNCLSEQKEGKLDYQIEYLIAGKKADKQNLKAVVQRLLMVREGMNYLYCVQDTVMNSETGSLAALLIGWTGIPALVGILKHALLLGWAYGESLMDVRTLLNGGNVPLFKTPESWAVTLDNLGRLDELLKSDGGNNQEGLAYRDYLRILLNLQSVSDQKKRGLDMVELNIKNMEGLSTFRVDHCIVGIREETEWFIKPVFLSVPEAFLGIAQSAENVTVKSGFAYH